MIGVYERRAESVSRSHALRWLRAWSFYRNIEDGPRVVAHVRAARLRLVVMGAALALGAMLPGCEWLFAPWKHMDFTQAPIDAGERPDANRLLPIHHDAAQLAGDAQLDDAGGGLEDAAALVDVGLDAALEDAGAGIEDAAAGDDAAALVDVGLGHDAAAPVDVGLDAALEVDAWSGGGSCGLTIGAPCCVGSSCFLGLRCVAGTCTP